MRGMTEGAVLAAFETTDPGTRAAAWPVPVRDEWRFHLEPKSCAIKLKADLCFALGGQNPLEKSHSKPAADWLLNGWPLVLRPRQMELSPSFSDGHISFN